MGTYVMELSPQMEQIVKQLAAEYGVDLSQKGASLSLDMPTRPDRWMIVNLDGTRISLTRCFVEVDGTLAPDLDMVFTLHAVGWEPVELIHAPSLWDVYVQAAEAAGLPIYDEAGEMCFDSFTEYWAQQLAAQGWLTQAHKVEEGEDEPTGAHWARMAGCQSTHTGDCYGELWQCAACGKTVCYAEGTDNHLELCDACWCKQYGGQEDDMPF